MKYEALKPLDENVSPDFNLTSKTLSDETTDFMVGIRFPHTLSRDGESRRSPSNILNKFLNNMFVMCLKCYLDVSMGAVCVFR